ncbi:type IV pilus biogenesis protein PilM [Polaromonas sp. JS666]|uniref:type IV pilus biogenesis protein PilM n=1 Tax=Polaromonas sp. (strain JS666 / ATCC BAA-500) TaxID=296591 RepID=UPI00005333B1|nr:type IV pilus biogenesis protein PilM [Polaromonas sp. JS666]ABE47298.1 PilM protein, putative [Polaromonas sp. JS666]
MPLLVTTFFISMMALLVAIHVPEQDKQFMSAKADVAATDVLAYREELINFINSNAGFSGAVSDSQITPLWGHQRRTNWSNIVSNGTMFVYEVTPSPEALLLDKIYRKTARSFMVGRNSSGTLVSANGLSTGITIPASVPNGSIVIVGK